MVAYMKIFSRRTDAEFPKLASRDLPQFQNKKLVSTYFFTGHTLFTTLLTGLFYLPLSDASIQIPMHPIPIAILIMLVNAKRS